MLIPRPTLFMSTLRIINVLAVRTVSLFYIFKKGTISNQFVHNMSLIISELAASSEYIYTHECGYSSERKSEQHCTGALERGSISTYYVGTSA